MTLPEFPGEDACMKCTTPSVGDRIANLKVSQAVELAAYLKETYKLEPDAGGREVVVPSSGTARSVSAAMMA